MRAAVEQTLRHPKVTLGIVRFYIWQRREEEAPKPAAIEYAGPTVQQGSPRDYAVLQSAVEVVRG